jgi:hypothetical protein
MISPMVFRPLLRRGVAWAMLALYALVASGIPLPMGLPPAGSAAEKKIAGKDRSQPFPCMDKACGCDSAERCFTNCCCHTPAETIAWAKARGIDAAVIDALMRRLAVAAAPPQARGCCAAKASVPEASCCSAGDDNPDETVCSDYQSLAADTSMVEGDVEHPGTSRDPSGDASSTCRVVTLKAMLACGGVLAEWASIGMSLPPPPIVQCDVACPQIGVITSWNADVLLIGGPPDLPPPRA